MSDLPVSYTKLTPQERRAARENYATIQSGLCWHCKGKLTERPPDSILNKPIKRHLFPLNFFKYPVHLHHNHVTDLTIGAVYNYCNAVLWQFYGE